MAKRRGLLWVLSGLLSVPLIGAVAACGEDGQALGDQCPKLPLYHYVDKGTGGNSNWIAVFPDGGPLSASAKARIVAAENAKCISPLGTAVSLGQDAGTTTASAGSLGKASAGSRGP